jgi:hypothetical protein
MRSIRMTLLVALIALGVTAICVAAAGAFEWRIEGKTMKALGLKEEAKSSEGGSVIIESKVNGGEFLEIDCEKEVDKGKIFSELAGAGKEGTGEETLEVSGKCKVVKPVGCTVAEPIKFVAKTRLQEIATVMYEIYEPLAGGMFGEATLDNCAAKGKYALKGALCGEVEPLLTELAEQPVRFSLARLEICAEKAGIPALSFGGEPANMQGQSKRKLTGGNANKKWGAQK